MTDAAALRGTAPARSPANSGSPAFAHLRLATRWRAWVALALLLCGGSAAQATGRIVLLAGDVSGIYQQVIDAIEAQILHGPEPAPALEVLTLPERGALRPGDLGATPPDLVLAIGSSASIQAAALVPQLRVLSILIPQSTAALLERELERRHGSAAAGHFSAIYLDQPFARQLQLLRLVLPDRRRLGVILGPTSSARLPQLREAAAAAKLELEVAQMTDGANPVVTLDAILDEIDVFLAVPDPVVFNRYSVKSILLSTYHKAIPVIAFSSASVAAGGLLAVHSSPVQIAHQASDLIEDLLVQRSWTLPPSQYPRVYSVVENQQVARSLGIRLPAASDLEQRLHRLEMRP